MKQLSYKYCCRFYREIKVVLNASFVLKNTVQYRANDIQIQHKYCTEMFIKNTQSEHDANIGQILVKYFRSATEIRYKIQNK